MSLGNAGLDGVVDAEIIKIDDELTGKTTEDFKAQVTDLFEKGQNQLILDCKAMKTINSEGLEALLWVIEEIQNAGGVVKIASLQKNAIKIFEITQFNLIFDTYEDVIAALKSL